MKFIIVKSSYNSARLIRETIQSFIPQSGFIAKPVTGGRMWSRNLAKSFFLAGINLCRKAGIEKRQSIVRGGDAKGVMFSAHVHAARLSQDVVIDINPAKQGEFLAASYQLPQWLLISVRS